MEVWKDIEGYEGIYQVSSLGAVKSLDRLDGRGHKILGKLLKQGNDVRGYQQVNLSKNGKATVRRVHRLVAETFIPNPEEKPQVNHIDGYKTNNTVDNLEWTTSLENNAHAFRIGLNRQTGEANCSVKLTEDDIRYIRRNYKPRCKEFGMMAMAKKFGISDSQVDRIIRRERWKHIE